MNSMDILKFCLVSWLHKKYLGLHFAAERSILKFLFSAFSYISIKFINV